MNHSPNKPRAKSSGFALTGPAIMDSAVSPSNLAMAALVAVLCVGTTAWNISARQGEGDSIGEIRSPMRFLPWPSQAFAACACGFRFANDRRREVGSQFGEVADRRPPRARTPKNQGNWTKAAELGRSSRRTHFNLLLAGWLRNSSNQTSEPLVRAYAASYFPLDFKVRDRNRPAGLRPGTRTNISGLRSSFAPSGRLRKNFSVRGPFWPFDQRETPRKTPKDTKTITRK